MKIEKTYCDICGKEVGLSAPLKTIKHTKKVIYTEILDNDCCEQCFYKIIHFINELKKKENKTC